MKENEVVKEIKAKVQELNALFEEAAHYYLMILPEFEQNESLEKGFVPKINFKFYKEL